MDESPQRPTSNNDRDGWRAYWTAQEMPWRTEPEIDEERQRYLSERRAVKPDIEKGVYPFRDESGGIKLTRADVEWLLATHESGGIRGPVTYEVKKRKRQQQARKGLDLRGVDLQGVDLRGLPLARTQFGKSGGAAEISVPYPGLVESILLRVLTYVTVQVSFGAPGLSGAIIVSEPEPTDSDSKLSVEFGGVSPIRLSGLDALRLMLRSRFRDNQAIEPPEDKVTAEGPARRSFAQLLDEAYIATADTIEGAAARLEHSNLQGAGIARSNLTGVHLEHANLRTVDARGAVFSSTHFDGADMAGADLSQAILRRASMSSTTFLAATVLTHATLADVQWNGVNVALIDWLRMGRVGDEYLANQRRWIQGKRKPRTVRQGEYSAAVRAYRQIAAALDSQGLTEQRNHFAFRAQIVQRKLLWRVGIQKWPAAIGSWFLWLISGYGYRPLRSALTYALVVLGFAGVYLALGGANGQPLAWNEAVVVSMTAFHGRGFFSTAFQPGDPQAAVAAVEALLGLFIEITLIATFTQRFFAR